MTFGNAMGALAVSALLLVLPSDTKSSRSRPTDLAANQEEPLAPAAVREPAARESATPRPAQTAPKLVEPAPSTPEPAAKPPATRSAPPSRTSAGRLATKESSPPPTITPPTTAAEPPPKSSPPPDVALRQPGTPAPGATLDLSSLEQRLRDTKAIGVFTKLSLKNQVDDLLQEFREFHKSPDQAMLTKLRQAFDLLLLKVLSLLQDSDPGLARDISSSRDELWSILTDPEKFKNVE